MSVCNHGEPSIKFLEETFLQKFFPFFFFLKMRIRREMTDRGWDCKCRESSHQFPWWCQYLCHSPDDGRYLAVCVEVIGLTRLHCKSATLRARSCHVTMFKCLPCRCPLASALAIWFTLAYARTHSEAQKNEVIMFPCKPHRLSCIFLTMETINF